MVGILGWEGDGDVADRCGWGLKGKGDGLARICGLLLASISVIFKAPQERQGGLTRVCY